jgi:hypothetical protein
VRLGTNNLESTEAETMRMQTTCIRHLCTDGTVLQVDFHSHERCHRHENDFLVEEMPIDHSICQSARAFADPYGPIFHIGTGENVITEKVDLRFEVPMKAGMCPRSLAIFKKSAGHDSWEDVCHGSFTRQITEDTLYLQVSTDSFSCWMLGCCRVRVAYHCVNQGNELLLRLILFSSDVTFPFPRRDRVGEMELGGFGIVKNGGKIESLVLKDRDRFQIKCSTGGQLLSSELCLGEESVFEFKHKDNFLWPPSGFLRIPRDSGPQDIHVWISEGSGGSKYVGKLPSLNQFEHLSASDDSDFFYFPTDFATQDSCCVCKRQLTSIMSKFLVFSAHKFCRFCGKSLCDSHGEKQKFFNDCDIGELCKDHADEKNDFEQKAKHRTHGLSASDGAPSRAKVTNLKPACGDPGNIDPRFERNAFLIGNGKYPDPNDRLLQPERDARKMGEALRKHGFKTEVFENQK